MRDDVLAKRLMRAELRVSQLETWLEDKTRELFISNEEALQANMVLKNIYSAMPGALVAVHADMQVTEINASALTLLDLKPEQIMGKSIETIWPAGVERLMSYSLTEGDGMTVTHRREEEWVGADGRKVPVLVSTALLPPETGLGRIGYLCVALDLRERRELEVQLRHAQKMESVGQLAAGIAHEINTPLQYISDNVHFLQDAFQSWLEIQPAIDRLKQAALSRGICEEAEALAASEAAADLDYLKENVPSSVERAFEGIERVTSIVRAVKAFSRKHNDCAPFDLNQGIQSTLEVTRNEYKYVAEVEASYGEMPLVICNGGEISQVVLNLLVNAAHAIAEKHGESGKRGVIRIGTRLEGDMAVIRVGDDGGGIPESIRHRIFDPFFTTKDVGKGTGQGLTIAHSIVCDRHGGAIDFETEPGVGTTFTLKIPVGGKPQSHLRGGT